MSVKPRSSPDPEEERSNSLFERLAAEEPPLTDSDTSRSITAPRLAIRPPGDIWQQYLGSMMLLASLIFTIAAGLVIFLDQDDSSDDAPVVASPVLDKPSLSTTPMTPQPSPTRIESQGIAFLPTAAVDEAAIALLTPVPAATPLQPVAQRSNLPFTQRSAGAAQRDVIIYAVQAGDTLDGLVERFRLSNLCTLVWSNERRSVSPLRPGNELLIPPVDGVFARIREPITLAKLAEETGVAVTDIVDSPYNPDLEGSGPDTLLIEGMRIMVPDGSGGNCNIWAASPTAIGDDTAAGTGPGGGDILSYIRRYGLANCSPQLGGGGWPVGQPVNNYQFFQGFSAFHTGVDLSAGIGEPVYSAGSGTVIFAGTNQYGYGKTIAIAHGTTFTIYGHLNSINVSCGQTVGQGQVVGGVGNTGNSTGPHLHFEIRNASFEAVDPCYTIRC